MDQHGQTGIGVRFSANQQKAFAELLGIAKGMVADRKMVEQEVLALDLWLKDNRQWLQRDPDYLDLVDCVSDVLDDGKVTRSELADIKQQLYTVLEYRDEFYSDDQAVTCLIGFVRGVLSDGNLADMEISALKGWLRSAGDLKSKWPVSQIANLVSGIVADGVITDEERGNLYDCLVDLVGGNYLVDGAMTGGASVLPVDNPDAIEFAGRRFCLTGKFLYGSRSKCASEIETRGGVVENKVIKKLDYLIIGDLASRDWANSTFGRKIEQAVSIREEGGNIHILSEQHWIKLLV